MTTIENKITVGFARSKARYDHAHRICADCLELSRQVLGGADKAPYRALLVGNGFASYNGTCYVCEQQAHVAVVERNT